MVASLQLEMDGLTASLGRLNRLADRFDDMSPLMSEIGIYGLESTEVRFETGVGPDGAPWAPSIRAKAKGGQTLVDQGHLRSSFSQLSGPRTAEWGTNLVYAGTHQFGLTIRAKGGGRMKFNIPGLGWRSAEEIVMPRREFLGMSREDEEVIARIADDYAAEALS